MYIYSIYIYICIYYIEIHRKYLFVCFGPGCNHSRFQSGSALPMMCPQFAVASVSTTFRGKLSVDISRDMNIYQLLRWDQIKGWNNDAAKQHQI